MYNSSSFRRPQPTAEPVPDKFRKQAQQLQEAFPSWSLEGAVHASSDPDCFFDLFHAFVDLHSLLLETNGDSEMASVRILEGESPEA